MQGRYSRHADRRNTARFQSICRGAEKIRGRGPSLLKAGRLPNDKNVFCRETELLLVVRTFDGGRSDDEHRVRLESQ